MAALITAPIQSGVRLPGPGVEVPLATLFIFAAAAAAGLASRRRTAGGGDAGLGATTAGVRPLAWPQAFFMLAAALGLAALVASRAWTDVLKESVQLAEVALVAPWLAARAVRRDGVARLGDCLAGVTVAVLGLAVLGWRESWPLALSDAKSAVFVVGGLPFLLGRCGGLRRPLREAAVVAVGLAVGVTFGHGGMLVAALVVVALVGVTAGRAGRWVTVAAGLALVMGSALQATAGTNPWSQLSLHFSSGHVRRGYIEARAALLAPRHRPFGGGLGKYLETINELRPLQPLVPDPRDQKIPRDGNCQYLVTLVEAGLPAVVALLTMVAWAACSAAGAARSGGGPGPAAAVAAIVGWGVAGLFCVFVSRGGGVWFGALFGAASALRPGVRPKVLQRRLLPASVVAGSLVLALVWAGEGDAGAVRSRGLRGGLDRRLRVVDLPDELAVGGGILKVEAEAARETTPPFVVGAFDGASGGGALAISEGAGKGTGTATLAFEVSEPGEYLLYGRVWWDDACSNSLRIVISEEATVLTDEVFGRWHVVEAARPHRLTAGTHTVRLENLEDGIRLDWLALRRLEAAR